MTRKIPKWKVTLHWISQVNNAEHASGSVRSAWTSGGAVMQALGKYPVSGSRAPSTARKTVYLIEVEPYTSTDILTSAVQEIFPSRELSDV